MPSSREALTRPERLWQWTADIWLAEGGHLGVESGTPTGFTETA